MTITTLSILESTSVGTPSGNYDGSTNHFYSDAVKAVGYYRGQGNIETVTLQVTGFEGIITIQATLDENPELANWVEIDQYDSTGSPSTETYPITITGNFCFIRAYITDFDAGTINYVNITY